MRFLIAGAGIGGLTAALCLAKDGHQVVLLEQSQAFSEVGAGLQCGANAMKVLQYLGLDQALRNNAVEPQAIHFREHDSGNILYQVPLGERYQRQYQAPYYHIHRADLQAALLEQAKALPNIQIQLGAQLVSFSENETSVTLKLSNGESIAGDCLIGADGVRSQVREQLLGTNSARFTGNVAWRAMVPMSALPNDFMPALTTNFVGPSKHIVMYYVRAKQMLNIVGVVEGRTENSTSWVQKAPWQDFYDDFAGWHPMVTQAINVVNKDQCYRWALYDHPPLVKWGSNRVTLLGDAAHATLPFMASGAAMAIEDARILQRCVAENSALKEDVQIKEALSLYQRNRSSRTAYVQKTSAKLGKLYHINNRYLQRAAFAGLKLIGPSKEAYLPSYDANTVALN